MKGIIQIGIVIIICFSCLSSRGQTSVFNWDVENSHYIQPVDAASFNINYYDIDGLTPVAASGIPVGSFSLLPVTNGAGGGDAAFATSWFTSSGDADNWIVFGPITHPSNVSSVLSWEHMYPANPARDGYEVLISTTGPAPINFTSATILATYTDNDPATSGHTSWTQQTAIIPASLIGGDVYIAFHHFADNQYQLALDDFDVTQTSIASTSSSFTVNQCNNYTVPSGDETYTTSGVYMDTIPNAAGGDSIMTITANILQPSTGTDIQTSCGAFTWIDGNTYSSSNNTATHTLTNSVGCDSVVTLNLTVNQPSSTTDNQTACNSFTWIDGVTYTSSNNTATQTLTNAAGCDSVVALNLTINTINNAVTQSGALLTANESGATYQWLICPGMTPISGATNQTYSATSNGDYAVIVNNGSCSDTSACYTVSSVGIMENDFGNNLLLYPNPTDGQFSIDFGETYSTATITITDLNGKIVLSKVYHENQLLNLQLEEPAGIYFLKVESGDKKAVIRLVKN